MHNLSLVPYHIWKEWMQYQLSQCTKNEEGSYTIPSELVERWQEQLNTEYDKNSVKTTDIYLVVKEISFE